MTDHPWLSEHTLKKREQEHAEVCEQVEAICESADRLLELLPATGRNKRHVKQVKHFAGLLETEARLRRVA